MIISLIFGVLSLILFFKVWKMCNDVARLVDKFVPKEKNDLSSEDANSMDSTTWIAVVVLIVAAIVLMIFVL